MIKVKSRKQLKEIIQERIEKDGYQCNLNDLDISNIIDLSDLFKISGFNEYTDGWDTSKVIDMMDLFNFSDFNQDISN